MGSKEEDRGQVATEDSRQAQEGGQNGIASRSGERRWIGTMCASPYCLSHSVMDTGTR